MPYKPKEITKLYYSISEVASMFNVAPSLIRFWEKQFHILHPQKNRKGNRQFTEKDIATFKLIHHLVKERGYTLEGAKMKLQEKKSRVLENIDVIESLEKVRDFLKQLKENF